MQSTERSNSIWRCQRSGRWKDDGKAAKIDSHRTDLSSMSDWKLCGAIKDPSNITENWNIFTQSSWDPVHCRLADEGVILALLTCTPIKHSYRFRD
ncbi:uncharacterized protein N7529_000178 [Penicillium soppii]|uniref:uncharacterized protein n=1 Tax=Penicillium soppii TaxID=69789 RepID=UPI002547A311|nr:uncharacterized protein N7529_000178 [Penicillium soppii]KAJ5881506.1 hypothetical protein N7529_000178 [Penicillium soppii]